MGRTEKQIYRLIVKLLDYNPETGVFRWKDSGSKFSNWRIGTIAGTDVNGYINITLEGRRYRAHRLAWLYVYGRWPKDQIDHRDLNRRNNAISNLREAGHSENEWNKPLRKDNQCGFKGVRKLPNGKWRSRIRSKHIEHHLGVFDTPEEAHAVYVRAAKKICGEFYRAS